MKRPHGLRLLSCLLLTLSFSYALWTFSVRRNHGIDIDFIAVDEIERNPIILEHTPVTKDWTIITGNGDENVEPAITRAKGVRVLIQSRFRTGSTLTERYFTRNPDFFGVHEPGGMLQRDIGLNIMQESHEKLEMIRENLMSFMHDIYHCQFSQHDYFLYGLNHMPYYLLRAYLTDLEKPITNDAITAVCRARPNKIIKSCRLFSILEAEQLLKEDDIKVIFLVRDPRAMAISRMHFTHNFTPLQNFKTEKIDEFRLDKKMEEVVPDYCEWLVENYFRGSNIPEWLKNRYLLIRYEDMQTHPKHVVQQMYDFVGVNMTDDIIQLIEELDLGNNSERWRDNLRIEEVLRIQQICGEEIFQAFGYKMVYSEQELHDRNSSVVLTMPRDDIDLHT
ncbi:carbohydrate sulfotransferase 4-like [Glandiceps talaboti]